MDNTLKKVWTTLQTELWNTADKKGHHKENFTFEENRMFRSLLFMVTELAEATDVIKKEGYQPDNPEWVKKLTTELADNVIRTLDFAESYGLPLIDCLLKKNQINLTRPENYGTPHEVKDETGK